MSKNTFGTLLLLTLPLLSYAADKTGIGGVAQNMLAPVGLMADFVYTACFAIGGSFIFAAIVKYFEHRRSPLMVPISTVVFFLIAGILLLLLPCLSFLSGSGFTYALLGSEYEVK